MALDRMVRTNFNERVTLWIKIQIIAFNRP